MTAKIILVGQAPGKAQGEPLAGASGRRLAALAGLDLAQLLVRFEHVSLLSETKGQFDLPAARARADQLREGWRGRKVVLLGRGVMAAFRLLPDDAAWFQPVEIPPGVEVACMPHPSGISHWWNLKSNVENARQFMQRLNLGFFAPPRFKPREGKAGRPPVFSDSLMLAAIKAADGIPTRAAELVAEETGRVCTRQHVEYYVRTFPHIAEARDECLKTMVDLGEGNVMRALRDGDVETSRWLLRSKIASRVTGGIYEAAVVEGRFRHEGSVTMNHALHATLEQIAARLSDQEVDVLEGVYRKLAEEPVADQR